MTGGHGAVPSPASSGGHEDDHSQRLYVSQYLYQALIIANDRLDHWLSANASMAVGSLTGPQLDTNVFQPLPNPSFDPSIMMNPAPAPSPFTQQWDMSMTPAVQMDWTQPVQGQFGGEMLMPGIPVEGGENSDEYWNALIDGESI